MDLSSTDCMHLHLHCRVRRCFAASSVLWCECHSRILFRRKNSYLSRQLPRDRESHEVVLSSHLGSQSSSSRASADFKVMLVCLSQPHLEGEYAVVSWYFGSRRVNKSAVGHCSCGRRPVFPKWITIECVRSMAPLVYPNTIHWSPAPTSTSSLSMRTPPAMSGLCLLSVEKARQRLAHHVQITIRRIYVELQCVHETAVASRQP